jgi:hypothetical protein
MRPQKTDFDACLELALGVKRQSFEHGNAQSRHPVEADYLLFGPLTNPSVTQ